MNVFYGSGDAGDLCASLPVIRHLGGGEFILGPHIGPGWPREPMTEVRANFLLPLIAAQPYITASVFEEKPQRVTHDLSMFRHETKNRGPSELLTHWHARHLNLQPQAVDLSPWLHVESSQETRGKVVIARSLRYHNAMFQWRRVLRKFPHRVFIGLPHEHGAFVRMYGPVDYRPVNDALEMARLIAGSELFIGNQSFPCWVAMALGKNLIQESYPPVPNSRIPRPNARFVLNQFSM